MNHANIFLARLTRRELISERWRCETKHIYINRSDGIVSRSISISANIFFRRKVNNYYRIKGDDNAACAWWIFPSRSCFSMSRGRTEGPIPGLRGRFRANPSTEIQKRDTKKLGTSTFNVSLEIINCQTCSLRFASMSPVFPERNSQISE